MEVRVTRLSAKPRILPGLAMPAIWGAAALCVALWWTGVQAADRSSTPLRVGTSGDYAPFSLRGEDGSMTGFDIEVAKAYAADRGRPVEFVVFRWPELQARLLAGDFDVAMGGITVRGDRLALAPMTNDFVALLKDSSLVSVLTVVELTKQTQIFAANVGTWFVPGLLCAALYLAMSLPLSHLARRLEERWKMATP